jgi:hypothetical protein
MISCRCFLILSVHARTEILRDLRIMIVLLIRVLYYYDVVVWRLFDSITIVSWPETKGVAPLQPENNLKIINFLGPLM